MVYFIAVDLREWGTTKKCLHKTRNEIYPKCRFTMKKILFTLLFIASKVKYISFRGWSEEIVPLKNVNKPERDIKTGMSEAEVFL